MKITKEQEATRKDYLDAKPKQFGNLHERMKLVMELLKDDRDSISTELETALHDLETEVSYHKPAKPPYGRRIKGEYP